MLNLCYVYYLSKLTEFADTTFFVLRKKKTQITWLHLYHHALTPMEAWLLVKFISGSSGKSFSSKFFDDTCWFFVGGNATFPNILNNFVHVLMYFYYMLAAMGPQYQKYLWWKKYMTELQIVSKIVVRIFHRLRNAGSTQLWIFIRWWWSIPRTTSQSKQCIIPPWKCVYAVIFYAALNRRLVKSVQDEKKEKKNECTTAEP